jgi:hypothetical protein
MASGYGKIFALGGMTERLKVTVLKTVVAQATVGSNPTPSARLTICDFRFTITAENRQSAVYNRKSSGEVPERPIGLAC